ncbi:Iduronate 2-sulfatase [Amphibalanus amphitrite]|uniref:Iduronate 2-sulfatase n=1 Tax=Amphibalanus amphitrite TaxID=1232801 RepID=A0A6A4WNQ2_AMPAM|nr:Iduronate 2-sulfatase [Amphibalanus amphitrite]
MSAPVSPRGSLPALLRALLMALAVYLPRSAACLPRRNVLLLLVDDLRPALGCYGDALAVTPSADALAAQSALFTAAFAQQALCAPSRTSLLTSRRPQTLRLFDTGSYWRRAAGNFTSLPQMFRERGYHTAAMGKVFHPGIVSNHSDDQPYSWSEPPYHPPAQQFKNWPVCLDADGELHADLFCPVDPRTQPLHTLPDMQTAERAVSWLKQRAALGASTEPWLLAVGLHKPHIPLKMPFEYLNLYPPESVPPPSHPHRPLGLPEVAWNPWMDLRRRHDVAQLNISFPYGPMPEFFSRSVRQGYYAAVSYADDLLGRVLAALADSGQAARTVVLLAGDHGWALGERGEWAKYSTSEDATRTPLLLHLPGETGSLKGFRHVSPLKAAGRRRQRRGPSAAVVVRSPVELLDVMPTLTEAALNVTLSRCPAEGSQPQLCTEGRSLLPLVRGIHRHGRTPAPRRAHELYHLINGASAGDLELQLLTNRVPNAPPGSPTRQSPTTGPCSGLVVSPSRRTAFSQYPRPSVLPRPDSDQPQLRDIRVMGYSVRTRHLRYTEWVAYDPVALRPHWDDLFARELYDHRGDPLEVENVADEPAYRPIVRAMSRLLRSQGVEVEGGAN